MKRLFASIRVLSSTAVVCLSGGLGVVQAEDINPPAFAGAEGWVGAVWEFDREPPEPSDFVYFPELTEPPDFFSEGGVVDGWNPEERATEVTFDRVYFPMPSGEGSTLTVSIQLTWEGAAADIDAGFVAPELWTAPDPEGGEYLGGDEGIEPLVQALGGGLWHGTWLGELNVEEDQILIGIIFELDDALKVVEMVVDAVVHDGAPPTGNGKRPGADPRPASGPSPDDAAVDVIRDVTLSWLEGLHADTHNVYFGTHFNDVNEATAGSSQQVGKGQNDAWYDPPGLLEWGQTYYWRVDEVNAPPDGTVFKGPTWSFTVEPLLPALAWGTQIVSVTGSDSQEGYDPNSTIDGSGLDAGGLLHDADEANMWRTDRNPEEPVWIEYTFDQVYKLLWLDIWNYNGNREDKLGYGFKDVVIEYSSDEVDYTAIDPVTLDWVATGSMPVAADTLALEGILAKQFRLRALSNFKTSRFGLSEVRLLYRPVLPREPYPPHGAAEIDPDAVLQWRPGREAVTHEVYLGPDGANLPLAATTTESRYSPSLLLEETYYWQVEEVNEAAIPSRWASDIWRFDTRAYLVIDDMESYQDSGEDANVAIWGAWVDGFDDPSNGSLVGDAFGGTEKQLTHKGSRQSMPFEFDNRSATKSEATYTLVQGTERTNWLEVGIRALTLYVYGDRDNTGGQLTIGLNDAAPLRIEGLDLGAEVWQEVNVDLAEFTVNLERVTSMTIGVAGAGQSGIVFIDDIRLYPSRCIPGRVLGDVTGDCIVDDADSAVIDNNWLRGPLAVEYTFESGFQDASGNMRHGQPRNGPLAQDGILTLTADSALDIPFGAENPFDGSRDFSVAIDFRTDAPGTLLSSARDDNEDNHAMAIFVDREPDEPFWAEVVYENYGVGSAGAEDDAFFLDLSLWHQLVVSYEAETNWIVVYLDGVAGERQTLDPAIPNIAADIVRLGGTLNTASPQVGGFVGEIDTVRIFNLALSADDVARLPRIPAIPGDVNHDGIVDQADRDIVEANQGPLRLWP